MKARKHSKRNVRGDNGKLVRAARKAGWRVDDSKAGVMIYPPDGSRPIPVHVSNRGGHRGVGNAAVQLRKAGLRV